MKIKDMISVLERAKEFYGDETEIAIKDELGYRDISRISLIEGVDNEGDEDFALFVIYAGNQSGGIETIELREGDEGFLKKHI